MTTKEFLGDIAVTKDSYFGGTLEVDGVTTVNNTLTVNNSNGSSNIINLGFGGGTHPTLFLNPDGSGGQWRVASQNTSNKLEIAADVAAGTLQLGNSDDFVEIPGDLTVSGDLIVSTKAYLRAVHRGTGVAGSEQQIANDTRTKVTFTTTSISDGSGFTFTSSRFINTSGITKYYYINSRMYYAEPNATGIRLVYITAPSVAAATAGSETGIGSDGVETADELDDLTPKLEINSIRRLEHNQFFEIGTYQNSGTELNLGHVSLTRYDLMPTLTVSEI